MSILGHAAMPDDAMALLQAGFARQKAGDLAGAEQAYRQAVQVNPHFHPGWANLAVVSRRLGRLEEAVTAYRRALEGAPDHAPLWGNLGNALRDLDRHQESIEALRRSLQLRPDSAAVWRNLAISLDESGQSTGAMEAFEQAHTLAPEDVEIAWLRCQLQLALGNFSPRVWDDFSVRWQLPRMVPLHGLSQAPRWRGGERTGKRLLVIGEQGFGDTILAVRFLRCLTPAEGELAFLCQTDLRRLLESPVQALGYSVHDASQPRPPHDLVVPVMDLIGMACASPLDIPPPLSLPPAELPAGAAESLAAPPGTLKVGIVWSGSVDFSGNARRAVGLERFLTLRAVPNVRLYSLQLGEPRTQLLAQPEAGIVDLAPLIGDFADTAALLQRLDLVIQTDTALAHLAGTLGIPVWNLLQSSPYHFYFRDRADCPWYPSMRLFRQRRPGDWSGVFAEVQTALTAKAAEHRAHHSS